MKATRKLYAIGKEHFARQLLYSTISPRVKRFCIDSNVSDIILLLHSWFAFKPKFGIFLNEELRDFSTFRNSWTLTLVIHLRNSTTFRFGFGEFWAWVEQSFLAMCLSSTASFYDIYNWPLKIGSSSHGYSVSDPLRRHHQQQQLRWKWSRS